MPSGVKSGDGYSVPHFSARLYATRNGIVIDAKTGQPLPRDTSPFGEISILPLELCQALNLPFDRLLTAALVAFAFKQPNLPLDQLLTLEVMYVDGNSRNLDPENLTLKYPSGGMVVKGWPGLYHVPGYSNYRISANGDVYSAHTGERKKASVGQNGYFEMSATSDADKGVTVGVHRLMALTFVDYPADVRTMFVDHVDMNKQNNAPSNLEWVTPAENTRRAYEKRTEEGLFGPAHGVDIKDLYTGKVLSFRSLAEAGRHFDTTAAHVLQSIKNHAMKTIFKQRYVVKTATQEWPNITKDDIKDISLSGGRPVLVKNVITGEITRYEKAMQFVRATGLSKKTIMTNLKKGRQVKLFDLVFKYEDNPAPWAF